MIIYLLQVLMPLQLFCATGLFPNTYAIEPTKNDDYINVKWKDLSLIQFEEKYSSEFQQLMPYPIFPESIKALDHKKVKISGYVIPLDENPEQPILVLSALPFYACFFCGAAGPETVMDIVPATQFKRMQMDKKGDPKGHSRVKLR